MSNARFKLARSQDAKHFFNLQAGNGEVVLTSEMYEARASALKGIASVRVHAPLPASFQRRESTQGEPYFVLRANNNEIIGVSEMYSSPQARDKGIAAVVTAAEQAEVVG